VRRTEVRAKCHATPVVNCRAVVLARRRSRATHSRCSRDGRRIQRNSSPIGTGGGSKKTVRPKGISEVGELGWIRQEMDR
jgi:hypothetical protein